MIPPVGGDTAFADLQAAYDALSAPVRALVDGLEAEHDGSAEFAEHLRERPEGGVWSGRRFTVLEPVVHPVVRVHPETGRRGLFVNPTFTTRIVGRVAGRERRAAAPAPRGGDGTGAHLSPPLGGGRRGRAGTTGPPSTSACATTATRTACCTGSPSRATDPAGPR